MAGRTPGHNRISGNLYIALSLGLKGQAYEVCYADQRLWIPDVADFTRSKYIAMIPPASKS